MSRSKRLLIATTICAMISSGAHAQTMPGMSDQSQAAAKSSAAAPYGPPMDDMPSFSHVMLDQLESRFGAGGDLVRWSGEAWTGDDDNRLWLKSEGEVQNGRAEDGRYEALYDRPITSFWDLQAGARADIDSRPGRAWAALGVEGLAPYFVAVSATAYASDDGHLAVRLEGSDDIRITQRLILQPQVEINAYSRDDPGRVMGSGLSDLDGGLRLRYEITRKLAPYVGVVVERRFGRTAALAKAASEQADATRWVVGLRGWF